MLTECVCFTELVRLIEFTRATFLQHVSKAKAAKLVRTLIDSFLDMEAGSGKEVIIMQLYSLVVLVVIFAYTTLCVFSSSVEIFLEHRPKLFRLCVPSVHGTKLHCMDFWQYLIFCRHTSDKNTAYLII